MKTIATRLKKLFRSEEIQAKPCGYWILLTIKRPRSGIQIRSSGGIQVSTALKSSVATPSTSPATPSSAAGFGLCKTR